MTIKDDIVKNEFRCCRKRRVQKKALALSL